MYAADFWRYVDALVRYKQEATRIRDRGLSDPAYAIPERVGGRIYHSSSGNRRCRIGRDYVGDARRTRRHIFDALG